VVTAAEILSVAAFAEGRQHRLFRVLDPSEPAAPVVSYCRIDDVPIRTREPVMEPDAVIVQDVTLIHQVDLFSGLSNEGYVLINTSRSFSEWDLTTTFVPSPRTVSSPAPRPRSLSSTSDDLAERALLGGFAAFTGGSLWTPFVKPSLTGSKVWWASATRRGRPLSSS